MRVCIVMLRTQEWELRMQLSEPDAIVTNLCGLFEHDIAQCSATAHVRWIKQPVLELS